MGAGATAAGGTAVAMGGGLALVPQAAPSAVTAMVADVARSKLPTVGCPWNSPSIM